ncbi:MAG: adenine deaminase [Verrucomicrobia bacterium]|nr:adenine deaminase [Verrucomicrobiota bacterium]MBU1909416.1 adenine deaminase [Verrucomicrobiota bacterium]
MDAEMIAAARGETPADLLLKKARVVNVFSNEIHAADVAVFKGHIVGFGDYEARETVDLQNRLLCPGFIDAHVHLESSMVTAPEFARAVVPRGVTAVVTDPHEIANVLGLDGIRYMLETSEGLPLRVFVMVPSCVPATDMETSGARLTAEDFGLLFQHPRVIGLAEMMNYPGVIHRVPEVLEKLAAAEGHPIDGHAPGLSGRDLAAYIVAGIGSDHECTTLEEAREKRQLGMHIFIRDGTTARNLDALLPLVTPAAAINCSFCTDDRHPADLLREGSINWLVHRAIQKGMDPVTAIRMATLHPARYFGLNKLGAIAPGYWADLVVLDDFEHFRVAQVYQAGQKVAENQMLLAPRARAKPLRLRSSVNVQWQGLDFRVPVPEGQGERPRIRVIGLVPDQILTKSLEEEASVADGAVVADPSSDLLKIAVIERHLASGNVGVGFVRGFGLKTGAIASSVAHDSHNIVVVGASDKDMMAAVKEVARLRGGQAVVENERVLASVPLPIAGLMSDMPLEEVRDRIEAMAKAAHEMGCTLPDPLMTMSFLALPVIPELKLTDKGLVAVTKFQPVPLFVE